MPCFLYAFLHPSIPLHWTVNWPHPKHSHNLLPVHVNVIYARVPSLESKHHCLVGVSLQLPRWRVCTATLTPPGRPWGGGCWWPFSNSPPWPSLCGSASLETGSCYSLTQSQSSQITRALRKSSGRMIDWLVEMHLFDQILIGRTIAGVTLMRKIKLLNPLYSGAGGIYADQCFLE